MRSNHPLDSRLRDLKRRVRLLLIERYALIGASAGAVTAAVLVLLSGRILLLLDYRLWAAVVIVGCLCGCVYAGIKRLDSLTIAIMADKRTGLKERISSAVSVRNLESPQDMERALIADASQHLAPLKPREVFRHKFGLPHTAFFVSMLVLFGIIFIPQIPSLQSETRREEMAVMKEEGSKIEKVAREIREQTRDDEKDLKKLAARLEKLGERMQSGRMEKKQAMLEAQRLEKRIDEQQDQFRPAKSMEQASAEMRKSGQQLAKEAAQRIAERENISPEEAMKQLPSDERLAELARKEGPLTESERHELEQAIAKYADPSSGLPIPLELAEALAKLAESKDFQRAMELMSELYKKLNLGNLCEADREMLEKQMELLAQALKDTDLDELARRMLENAEMLANMTPEEIEELLRELQRLQELAQLMEKAGEG